MIDHIGIAVSDYARAKTWYARALAPLGFVLVMEVPAALTGRGDSAGFGEGGKPEFWIAAEDAQRVAAMPRVHVAFRAARRSVVDAFYGAAIGAGGTDNGKPGLRPHYHPNYYGAFVHDPDGHNIEVVCHAPE